MINEMNLKAQLRSLLRANGMTAADLSRATGIPKQSISDWLAGVAPRDLRRLKKVAGVFGVTVDELVFGEFDGSSNQKMFDFATTVDDDGWITGLYEIRFRRVQHDRGGNS